MYRRFEDIFQEAKRSASDKTICIAGAADSKMIHLAAEIQRSGLCRQILVGDTQTITVLAGQWDLDLGRVTLIHEADPEKIGPTAVAQVSTGNADVYVKGMMNTGDFLRTVLDKEIGLRKGGTLSVLTCYDVPKEKKLFFLTDGGMVIAPTLAEKAEILRNAVTVLHYMGIQEPKVAILSSNEKVSEKLPSTVDAAALCRMGEAGDLPKAIYEGPIAFDVAMRPEAAKEKHIASKISGDVDLFLVPNIETGNCLGKAIGYFGGGDTAGILIGARKPVVMSSRAASIRGKLTAVAWALLAG